MEAKGYDFPFYDVERQLKLAAARKEREKTEEADSHLANMEKVKERILKKVVEEIFHVNIITWVFPLL